MSVPTPPYYDTVNRLLYSILQHFEENPVSMSVPRPPFYNVTSDLLYAILDKLNGSQIVYTGIRVLYVSSRYGDDFNAEPNNDKKPFRTIERAKNYYFYNDVIHVMEGTYNEGYLSGNYNYWFDFGAEVVYSGSGGAIFQQRSGQCIVRGYGKFRCTGNASVIDVGNWLNCVLDIECESIEAVQRAIVLWQNRPLGSPIYFKPHRIKAKRAYSSQAAAVHYFFNVHAEVEIDEIVSDSINEATVLLTHVNKGYIRNARIISNNYKCVYANSILFMTIDNCEIINNNDSSEGHGFDLNPPFYNPFKILSTSITLKNSAAKSIYVTNPLNLALDNNTRANRDTFGPIVYAVKNTKIILDTNETLIDVTGLTSIDLSSYQNADIIRLTSTNASETIQEIVSAPKHHSYKIVPENGLSVTIHSADALMASEISIVLESASVTLNGSRGDWIELYNGIYGMGNRQVSASSY